jgi:hypothetical protein
MAQVDQAQVQTPVLERDRQKDREKKKKNKMIKPLRSSWLITMILEI